MQTILVPLDGTRHSLVALPVARRLASLMHGTIHVLHVAQRRTPPDELLDTLGLSPDELEDTVLDLETGAPENEILRAAERWDDATIVLCTHTGMEKPYGALGHVAWAVLQRARHPIILVQPERGFRPWEIDHILLPHDGTPTTAVGFSPAAKLAVRTHAELAVVYVAEPREPRPEEPGTYTVPRYVDQPQHEWPAWAGEFLERVCGLGRIPAGLRLTMHLAHGDPGHEIVEFARRHGTDLILLAWHGRSEPERARTLRTVVHEAPCPVLIYRIPNEAG